VRPALLRSSFCSARRFRDMFSRIRLATFALVFAVLPLAAQQVSWPTTHQQALWVTTSVEHELSARTALWFDGSWRRMGIGEEPQQLLLRPGIIRTLAPGVRVGAGYTYVATAPYGELPAATPTREHRLWQDLRLAASYGPVNVTQRFRWEQRWLAPLVQGTLGEFAYQQRARYMIRAQAPLGARRIGTRAVTWYAQEELLLPVGHDGAAGRFAQNRFLVGIGLPIAARQRVDVGYQNLWNALPSRSANEVNHVVTLSMVITSGRR
jgi:hypothetical protein